MPARQKEWGIEHSRAIDPDTKRHVCWTACESNRDSPGRMREETEQVCETQSAVEGGACEPDDTGDQGAPGEGE